MKVSTLMIHFAGMPFRPPSVLYPEIVKCVMKNAPSMSPFLKKKSVHYQCALKLVNVAASVGYMWRICLQKYQLNNKELKEESMSILCSFTLVFLKIQLV